MAVIWGSILLVISGLGYFGQFLSAFWPQTAVKLGLTEAEADVNPAYYADLRGEAYWDAAILWTLPVAAVLLVINNPAWAYFGLVGGGMFLYFSGRGLFVRREMHHRGIRIGTPQSVRIALVFLTLWGLTAAITIIMAVLTLLVSA